MHWLSVFPLKALQNLRVIEIRFVYAAGFLSFLGRRVFCGDSMHVQIPSACNRSYAGSKSGSFILRASFRYASTSLSLCDRHGVCGDSVHGTPASVASMARTVRFRKGANSHVVENGRDNTQNWLALGFGGG